MVELHHFDIQSTGQKSHCVNIDLRPSQCFVLIKQSGSCGHYEFVIDCLLWRERNRSSEKAQRSLSPSTRLPDRPGPPARGPASQFRRLARFMDRAPTIQSDEPFHIANLRNQFADFPYLHCSIDQRLLTLETCCGYEYGWDGVQEYAPSFSRSVPSAPDG